MRTADLFDAFERQIVAAERQYEETKAELFHDPLTADEFVERRAHVRQLETALGELHATRREIALLCHPSPERKSQAA